MSSQDACVRALCTAAHSPLNPDPLDLVERDLVTGAVIKLGGAWAFMRGHELRVFERTAGVHIGGDAGRPKRMAIDAHLEPHGGRAALDHAIGVDTVHGFVGECATVPHSRAEEGTLAAVTQPGRVDRPTVSPHFDPGYIP